MMIETKCGVTLGPLIVIRQGRNSREGWYNLLLPGIGRSLDLTGKEVKEFWRVKAALRRELGVKITEPLMDREWTAFVKAEMGWHPRTGNQD
jgi:hypothetical protein